MDRQAPLLTTRELAELLGVSRGTILKWTERGDLPGIRLPSGELRFRPGDLDSWLDARARTGPRRSLNLVPRDEVVGRAHRRRIVDIETCSGLSRRAVELAGTVSG